VDPGSHCGIELQARPLRTRQNPGQRVVRQSPDISAASDRAVRSGKPALLIGRSRVIASEPLVGIQLVDIVKQNHREELASLVDRDGVASGLDESVQ